METSNSTPPNNSEKTNEDYAVEPNKILDKLIAFSSKEKVGHLLNEIIQLAKEKNIPIELSWITLISLISNIENVEDKIIPREAKKKIFSSIRTTLESLRQEFDSKLYQHENYSKILGAFTQGIQRYIFTTGTVPLSKYMNLQMSRLEEKLLRSNTKMAKLIGNIDELRENLSRSETSNQEFANFCMDNLEEMGEEIERVARDCEIADEDIKSIQNVLFLYTSNVSEAHQARKAVVDSENQNLVKDVNFVPSLEDLDDLDSNNMRFQPPSENNISAQDDAKKIDELLKVVQEKDSTIAFLNQEKIDVQNRLNKIGTENEVLQTATQELVQKIKSGIEDMIQKGDEFQSNLPGKKSGAKGVLTKMLRQIGMGTMNQISHLLEDAGLPATEAQQSITALMNVDLYHQKEDAPSALHPDTAVNTQIGLTEENIDEIFKPFLIEARNTTRRIRDKALGAVINGNLFFNGKRKINEEIGRIFDQNIRYFSERIQELKTNEIERIRLAAYTDASTGFLNQSAFDEKYFPEIIAECMKENKNLSLLLMSIDERKADRPLDDKGVGSIAKDCVHRIMNRKFDSQSTYLFRYDTKMFVILITGQDLNDIEKAAQTMIRNLKGKKNIKASFCIVLTEIPLEQYSTTSASQIAMNVINQAMEKLANMIHANLLDEVSIF